MKRIILISVLLCLSFTCNNVFAQPRLGQALMQVKNDLSQHQQSGSRTPNEGTELTVKRFDKGWVETHIFNKYGVCEGCIITPVKKEVTVQLMKEYNSKYTYSKPNNRWIVNNSSSILLLYLEDADLTMFIHASNKDLNHFANAIR